MSDLISKEALLNIVGKMPLVWEYGQAVSDIYNIISEQPTVEAKPIVCGEWFYPEGYSFTQNECSICGIVQGLETNFCPNCGADMRKKVE